MSLSLRGVPHLRVLGKGSKTRPVPVHPAALSALGDYLELAPHRRDRNAPLFQPTQARWAGRPLTGDGIYKLVRKYASAAAIPMERIVHALRATAATNALEHDADIARVQDWLGHANVSTTFERLFREAVERVGELVTDLLTGEVG